MRCLKTEKSVLMIVFVQISARFSFDIIRKTTMVPFSTNSRVKWNATCICLLLSPIQGLCAKSSAPVLSVERECIISQ